MPAFVAPARRGGGGVDTKRVLQKLRDAVQPKLQKALSDALNAHPDFKVIAGENWQHYTARNPAVAAKLVGVISFNELAFIFDEQTTLARAALRSSRLNEYIDYGE